MDANATIPNRVGVFDGLPIGGVVAMKMVGIAMVLIGTMMADSESLVLPVVMMAIGAWLMIRGSKA